MTDTVPRKWVPTSVQLHPDEKQRLKDLGVPLRTVILVGLDALERQQGGEGPPSPDVPHLEMLSVIRSAVQSEVARQLDERAGGRVARARKRAAPVKHVTPEVPAAGSVPFRAAEA
jgi:hypothetical protein